MNLYRLVRKVVKLPRPNEIWGNEIRNSWRPYTIYLYFRMCMNQTLSHVGAVMGLFNTIVGLLILFELKDIASPKTVILGGLALFLFILALGHTIVAVGIMKKETMLLNSQNPEIREILVLSRRSNKLCLKCGKKEWQINKSGELLCYDCENS